MSRSLSRNVLIVSMLSTRQQEQRDYYALCQFPINLGKTYPWTSSPGSHHITATQLILVVIDRFSKGVHLGMLLATHTAHAVASLFMEIMGKIHGLPRSLVSDCDPLFVSKFWQELFRRSDTRLRMSSAYHPQSDGQTEVLNRVIEQCLRTFVHRRPREWGKFLLWVEWSHNTSWNATTGTTPYEITFGRKSFNFPEYIAGSSALDAVDEMLTNREETF